MNNKKLFILIIFLLIIIFPGISFAQNSSQIQKDLSFEAQIERVIEEKMITHQDKEQIYQKLELVVTNGDDIGKKIIVENSDLPLANIQRYQTGDKVLISIFGNTDNQMYVISDYIRRDGLFSLFVLFVIVTVFVAGWGGLRSIIGMGISFLIVYFGVVSSILKGINPIISTLGGSTVIIPVTFYLSHGRNRKTTVAIIGTIITLIFAIILASFSLESTKLTGFSSEDAAFVQVLIQDVSINMKGILLAGIIIGLLGVLDDITISQASIIEELANANAQLSIKQLYVRGMNVGKDHIASMVNTLMLVYAGSSLPLFLLFYHNPHPFSEVINYEIIADEIVRTLVGSISLILAVPITTLVAAIVVKLDLSSGYRTK